MGLLPAVTAWQADSSGRQQPQGACILLMLLQCALCSLPKPLGRRILNIHVPGGCLLQVMAWIEEQEVVVVVVVVVVDE